MLATQIREVHNNITVVVSDTNLSGCLSGNRVDARTLLVSGINDLLSVSHNSMFPVYRSLLDHRIDCLTDIDDQATVYFSENDDGSIELTFKGSPDGGVLLVHTIHDPSQPVMAQA